ncbi:hypothetical protein MUK42_19934, partial [Musa troglodytarum]
SSQTPAATPVSRTTTSSETTAASPLERLGRAWNCVRHAEPAHHRTEAHLHLPHERRQRPGKRDVGRNPGRASRAHHIHQHRVRGQGSRRHWKGSLIREGHIREEDEPAACNEVGLLDDRLLHFARRRQVQPQRHPRRSRDQLQRRGRRERDHGEEAGGDRQGALPR